MNKNTPRPTSIRIFLADGLPEGLKIVEKSNWTGRAVVVSRTELNKALTRPELKQPGVYILTGPSEEGTSRLYIGEADFLGERIKQHIGSKDFWTKVIAFTSTNESLNKAHVRYLESKLLELAKDANQWEIDNGTYPAAPPMSEADRADAEWFISEMLLIFPILGIDAFEPASSESDKTDSTPMLYLRERGADACGHETADGFVVFKGSKARVEILASIHNYMKNLREQLIDRGILREESGYLIFTQDFRFTSPSTAAGTLVGGAANGRTSWKDKNGKTLKNLQNERAEFLKE